VPFTADNEWDPNGVASPAAADNDLSLQLPAGHVPFRDERINNFGLLAHSAAVSQSPLNADALQPNFGWVPSARISRTFENTTQFARAHARLPLRKHFKSRFPAANVSRLNKIVAADTFFSDTLAADDGIFNHGGATMAQLFVGKSSQITSVFPMKRESQFAHTFEDFIRTHGAPDALLSNNACAQIGKQALQILRMYAIDDIQCEPHHQHQNYAERRIQEVKKMVNTIMDCTNTPPEYWLLCLSYVTYLLNRLAVESLNWRTPLQVAHGQRPDISALLLFRWFEPVYYYNPDHASKGC
jgi:hypothetical protein